MLSLRLFLIIPHCFLGSLEVGLELEASLFNYTHITLVNGIFCSMIYLFSQLYGEISLKKNVIHNERNVIFSFVLCLH